MDQLRTLTDTYNEECAEHRDTAVKLEKWVFCLQIVLVHALKSG